MKMTERQFLGLYWMANAYRASDDWRKRVGDKQPIYDEALDWLVKEAFKRGMISGIPCKHTKELGKQIVTLRNERNG